MRIAFFGSSLLSAYWNGAATYYRGLIRALHARGHNITFYEPDAYGRQEHRDIEEPEWARVSVFSAEGTDGASRALEEAAGADLIIKASGIGILDEWLEREVLSVKRTGALVAFLDVDAPATLDRLHHFPSDPFKELIPQYDLILTYGGGPPVVNGYESFHARTCVPIYNALDPDTHFRVTPDPRFECDAAFLGNRLPDREARVDEFFFEAARHAAGLNFILGGSGWADKVMPSNVRYAGHIYTADHNAFNSSPAVVLNVHRESMARYGYSPATRMFEAAGSAACMITDAFQGLEEFLEPNREILIAHNGREVAELTLSVTPSRARQIGEAARQRILAKHTYAHRAAQLDSILCGEVHHAYSA